MSNMALWDLVYKTDPKHVKKITGKQYQGSSPKPYYLIEKATSVFGSCGIGWGINVISERFERFGDTESQHIALVEIWYIQDGKRGAVQQMGQTRSSYVTSAGKFTVDEDAAKKSVTDGMVKCLSMLGFAGDIFGGRWDDSKYQDELANDFADKISDENFELLNAGLDETNSDKEAFCKILKVASLKDIPAAQVETAFGMLQTKRNAIKADMEYKALCEKHIKTLSCIRDALANEDYSTAKEAWVEIGEEEQEALWKAPSKGGWFTTREREQMKSNEWSAA